MLKEKENNSIRSSSTEFSDISRNVSLLVENTEESIRNSSENNNNNPENINNNSNSINNNQTNVNNENSNTDIRTLITTQGFSRFRQYGMSSEEIHMLRVMFHTNFLINNRNAPQSAWSPREVIQREEAWIQQVDEENNRGNRRSPSATRRLFFNRLSENPNTLLAFLRRDNNNESVIEVEVTMKNIIYLKHYTNLYIYLHFHSTVYNIVQYILLQRV